MNSFKKRQAMSVRAVFVPMNAFKNRQLSQAMSVRAKMIVFSNFNYFEKDTDNIFEYFDASLLLFSNFILYAQHIYDN